MQSNTMNSGTKSIILVLLYIFIVSTVSYIANKRSIPIDVVAYTLIFSFIYLFFYITLPAEKISLIV